MVSTQAFTVQMLLLGIGGCSFRGLPELRAAWEGVQGPGDRREAIQGALFFPLLRDSTKFPNPYPHVRVSVLSL